MIQQQVLLPTTQGIAVTPKLLPDGQVEVQLSQVEEALVNSNSSYQQNPTVQAQRLNSTVIVPRGQWVTIGQIAQEHQTQNSGYGSSTSMSSSVPILLLIK